MGTHQRADHDQELSCDEVEALLPLVADGVLGATDEPNLFAHLSGCPRCQASLANFDAIDIILSNGHSPQPAHLGPEVVHYRLPLPWALAASALLGLALGTWLLSTTPSGNGASSTTSTTATSPGIEILDVLPVGPGREQPVFVIRDGETIRVISGNQLDGGIRDQRPPSATAVHHGRQIDQIRQLGAVD